jgi:hypothetical protein
MAKLLIEANICEIDGVYYPVKLHSVPRVGELIDLFSFIEQANNRSPMKHYEVVQVVHKIYDVAEKIPQSKDGQHFVTVFVKPSDSKFFE